MNHEKSSRWLKGFTALFSFGVVIFDYVVLIYNNGHVGMDIRVRQTKFAHRWLPRGQSKKYLRTFWENRI